MSIAQNQIFDEDTRTIVITQHKRSKELDPVFFMDSTGQSDTLAESPRANSTEPSYTKDFIVNQAASLFEEPKTAATQNKTSDTSFIQIWEGVVDYVDDSAKVMHAILHAKIGQMPDHVADISLQWVAPQDRDLVRPGAIFYLTLFKRIKRGAIENTQDIRFRRFPAWSKQQVARVYEDAKLIASKFAEPTLGD